MARYRLRATADDRIDEIVDYTRRRWGREQAARYIEELFAQFQAIANRDVPWTPIPKAGGVEGYRRSWRYHVIYWKQDEGDIAIVSILHKRMDQFARLRDEAGDE